VLSMVVACVIYIRKALARPTPTAVEVGLEGATGAASA